VRARGLWAAHLGPNLGGNEILGRSQWAPRVFGTQALDTGNAEILAHNGTPEQKANYLAPLLEGDIVSCYSMTELQGGSDPGGFLTRAMKDGDTWVINGWKFFSSHARWAEFLIVMAVTDPGAMPYRGMSMFLVPRATPGLDIVRNIGLSGEAFDMRCERALSAPPDDPCSPINSTCRVTSPTPGPSSSSSVSWCCRRPGRSIASRTTNGSARTSRRSRRLHPRSSMTSWGGPFRYTGALGISNELDLGRLFLMQFVVGFADGPSEVHKATVARRVLKRYAPTSSLADAAPPDSPGRGSRARPGAAGPVGRPAHRQSWAVKQCDSVSTPSNGPAERPQPEGIDP
jgi:alkylation response protein AidB-like acyl-CoA dehydrogenase